jgi:hypothetical protein
VIDVLNFIEEVRDIAGNRQERSELVGRSAFTIPGASVMQKDMLHSYDTHMMKAKVLLETDMLSLAIHLIQVHRHHPLQIEMENIKILISVNLEQ